jgi:hypothetical protein
MKRPPLARAVSAATLAILSVSACAPVAAGPTQAGAAIACAGPGAHPSLAAQLLFGRSLHGGGEVSDAQWENFLATEVTPRFPDGLTALDAAGQWRAPGSDRIVAERSKLLLIVAEDTAQSRQRLEEIRDAYRARFAQDSVGLITEAACAAF